MRDGVPLSGGSPAEVVSQLAHRVFGPLRAGRARMVLDYHGLAGREAGTVKAVAARYHLSTPTVSGGVARVRAAGVLLPLRPVVVRDSRPGEDHLGRTRIAATLGLPPPAAPSPQPVERPHGAVPAPHLAAARAAARVLAAAGPLDLGAAYASVTRARRFRDRTPLSVADLRAALQVVGATAGADGRWRAPPGFAVPVRYRAVVAAAAGREMTRSDMITVLVNAGYSPPSAAGRMSSSHPLFQRVGPDRYRLIGSPPRSDAAEI